MRKGLAEFCEHPPQLGDLPIYLVCVAQPEFSGLQEMQNRLIAFASVLAVTSSLAFFSSFAGDGSERERNIQIDFDQIELPVVELALQLLNCFRGPRAATNIGIEIPRSGAPRRFREHPRPISLCAA